MVQYSRATNAAISSSRSQIMRSAGLCTRPADRPGRTFFHSSGERLKPTRKSSARRACCALTRSTDSSRGLRHRFAHRVLGDLVEHHALHVLALELALRLQELVQMPGDGLALAVGVGREEQRLGLLQRARDGVDVLLVALDHLVLHREVVLRVDRAFLRHEIAHVAVRGEHLEVLAEVFLDGLRLGRRFHDNEVAAQMSSNAKRRSALRRPGLPSARKRILGRAG